MAWPNHKTPTQVFQPILFFTVACLHDRSLKGTKTQENSLIACFDSLPCLLYDLSARRDTRGLYLKVSQNAFSYSWETRSNTKTHCRCSKSHAQPQAHATSLQLLQIKIVAVSQNVLAVTKVKSKKRTLHVNDVC